jgi:hypothetical protein
LKCRNVGFAISNRFPFLGSLILRGLCFPTDLLFDFPVGEQILVSATRALPRPLDRIGPTLVEHLHDEVAMKTHGRVA